MTNKLEKRMYILVNRSLSQMQKGIQTLHAVVEYGLQFPTTEYFEWANEYKTVIILDGGTSNSVLHLEMDSSIPYKPISSYFEGNMENQHLYLSEELNMNVAQFKEPDVNNCLTAIAFIVDERVFDREKYLDFEHDLNDGLGNSIRYKGYIDTMGGEKNVKLREFLSKFRLAL